MPKIRFQSKLFYFGSIIIVVNLLLFCKTESGAEIAARLFTIIQTAKANGLIPEKYIEWCIENSDRPADELLPWSKHVPDDVKALKGKL